MVSFTISLIYRKHDLSDLFRILDYIKTEQIDCIITIEEPYKDDEE